MRQRCFYLQHNKSRTPPCWSQSSAPAKNGLATLSMTSKHKHLFRPEIVQIFYCSAHCRVSEKFQRLNYLSQAFPGKYRSQVIASMQPAIINRRCRLDLNHRHQDTNKPAGSTGSPRQTSWMIRQGASCTTSPLQVLHSARSQDHGCWNHSKCNTPP